MEPAILDLSGPRGDTFTKPIRIKLKSDGSYVNLTGKTVTAQMRLQPDDTVIVATYNVTVHDQTVTPGGVTLGLTPSITATIMPDTYYWDLQVEGDPTDVTTYVRGRHIVLPDVTR